MSKPDAIMTYPESAITYYTLCGYQVIVDEKYVQFKLDDVVSRDDGPAMMTSNGLLQWFLNGDEHRGGGYPSTVWQGGVMHWRVKGAYSRPDGGPTIIHFGKNMEWHQNNKLHRLDGPAIIDFRPNMTGVRWYIDGIEYSYEEWLANGGRLPN